MVIREEEGTGEVQSKIKFWEVVRFAQTSELVDDDFLERLKREGLSPSINEELVSVLLQADAKQSGWFNRFTSVLREHPKYRSSSVQLEDIDGETPRVDQVDPRPVSTGVFHDLHNIMAEYYHADPWLISSVNFIYFIVITIITPILYYCYGLAMHVIYI